MTLKDQLDALLDATAFDSTGTKIGAVRQIYIDDATGKATFATVATGIFSSDAIVPLHGARLLEGELHVDHTRSAVKDSPRPDHTEDALTPAQEIEILEHYGVELPDTRDRESAPAREKKAGTGAGAGRASGAVAAGAAGAATSAAGKGTENAGKGTGKTTTRPSPAEKSADPAPADAAKADAAPAGKATPTTAKADGPNRDGAKPTPNAARADDAPTSRGGETPRDTPKGDRSDS